MNKKIIWLIVSGLMVVALVLASCAPAVVEEKEAKVVTKEPEKKAEEVEEVVEKEGPQYGGTLTRQIAEPLAFDPSAGQKNQDFWCLNNEKLLVGDWLLTPDPVAFTGYLDGQMLENLVGNLAESWEQPDPLTIIVKLRKGITWNAALPHIRNLVGDRELTADDVVWTYNYVTTRPKLAGEMLSEKLESVTATDKYTVTFKLTEQDLAMTRNVLIGKFTVIMCPDVYQEYGDFFDWRNMCGTGPFIISDYMPGVSLTAKRNPAYWRFDERNPKNRLPYIDAYRQLFILDEATRIAAFRTGKVDLLSDTAGNVLSDAVASLEATNPQSLKKGILGNCAVLAMNIHKAPFNDIKVRKAISMAMNRQEIVECVFGGHAEWWAWPNGPASADFIGFDELAPEVQAAYTYDPEAAKALLADAGYPNGFEMEVIYRVSTGKMDEMVELCHAYWDAIGIKANLRLVDKGTWSAVKKGHEFDDIFAGNRGFDPPLSNAQRFAITGGDRNFCELSDPWIDEQVVLANVTEDEGARMEILRKVWEYYYENVWMIGLPSPYSYNVWHPWLKGYNGQNSLGYHVHNNLWARVWIDQDLKKEMGY